MKLIDELDGFRDEIEHDDLTRYLEKTLKHVEPALESLVALRAAYPKLREAVLALEETLDDLEETLPYADDYFKKKWRLGRSLKRGRVVLRALGEGRDDETD